MIEHEPWLGACYASGLATKPGERIAIVGHSHYSDHDHLGLTREVVGDVVDGKSRHGFFTSIAKWFGYENQAAFYNSVMFFNYLPSVVGPKKNMSDKGTPEQIKAAKARFLRLLETHRPQRVFVFSTEAWRDFPESDCEPERVCTPLGEGFPKDFNWDTYSFPDHRVKVVGVRHPRGAGGFEMHRAVELGLRV